MKQFIFAFITLFLAVSCSAKVTPKEYKAEQVIAEFEGLRLNAYKCPAGVLTIGYGSTNSALVSKGTISKEEATKQLLSDIEKCDALINECVKVPLTHNQRVALVSFIYNVGGGNFRNSTLLRKLNNNEIKNVPIEFLRWNKSKGKVLRGLVKRRSEEARIFVTPDK